MIIENYSPFNYNLNITNNKKETKTYVPKTNYKTKLHQPSAQCYLFSPSLLPPQILYSQYESFLPAIRGSGPDKVSKSRWQTWVNNLGRDHTCKLNKHPNYCLNCPRRPHLRKYWWHNQSNGSIRVTQQGCRLTSHLLRRRQDIGGGQPNHWARRLDSNRKCYRYGCWKFEGKTHNTCCRPKQLLPK